MDIVTNSLEFTNLMIEFKKSINNSLEKSISFSILEDIRINHKYKYSKERFRSYFINKTTLHLIFKYIFIRMSEDMQKFVKPKFNNEGIRNWNEMSKNYRKDYFMLFNIASKDIRRVKQVGEIFEVCIYDKYIEKFQRSVFNTEDNYYIERLKEYDFKTLNPNVAVSLFDKLYLNEDRDNLQGFLEESKVTTFLMKSLDLI